LTFAATIKDNPDGYLGDISKASPLTFTLNGIGGTSYGCQLTYTASTGKVSLANAGTLSCPAKTTATISLASQTMSVSVTFAAGTIGLNVYDVSLAVATGYYSGQEDGALTLYDPSQGGANGGGSLQNPTGQIVFSSNQVATYAFQARYNSSSGTVGKMIYILTTLDSNGNPLSQSILKGNVMSTMTITTATGGGYPKTAKITGKSTLNGVGNYSYVLTVTDQQGPAVSNDGDTYGMQVSAPSGAPPTPTGFSFAPVPVAAGSDIFIG
jgi:hypothetical protein